MNTPIETGDEISVLSRAFNIMVEELQRSKDEIVSASRYLDRIIHSMVDALFVVCAEGVITNVNPAACQLLHYRSEDLVGHLFTKVFMEGEQSENILGLLARDGIVQGVEIACRTREGEAIPVSFSASIMDNPAVSSQHRVCIAHNISSRKQAEREIEQIAYYDQLTGLPNRFLFGDRLSQAMARAQRDGHGFALLFFDLDRFKDINDTLGHDCGDVLLQGVAQRLDDFVRRSDTVARLGGDEFVLLCGSNQGEVNAEIVARRLLEIFASPFDLNGNTVYVTSSIGIALYPADGVDAATLLRNADLAMYAAKGTGRNTFHFFSEEMNREAQERKFLGDELRMALSRREFSLHYQPQIDLRSGSLFALEAFLRWSHPQRGMISPSTFIPVAERNGLIREIGEWVLREACRQMRSWLDDGYPLMGISVNVSGRHFLHPSFHTLVASVLRESGMEPALLELEITESVCMADPKESVQSLKRLKALGVRLAMDDFGTGYSSLNCLLDFPLDRLKIDRALIRRISQKAPSAVLVDAVIAIAHSLGLRVLAEGVETPEEFAYLKAQGCDDAQGYLFARPMPARDVEKLFRVSFPLHAA